VNNKEVAEMLYHIADLLDIKGEMFFKTRAYRLAAQRIEFLEDAIEDLVKEERMQEIPGIGEALAKKITEFVETGRLSYLEELNKEVPEGIVHMLDIPGLGPKKVAAIYNNLGIKSIDELKEACQNGKLRDMEGFGAITELNILRGINLIQQASDRALLNVALNDGERYTAYLAQCPAVDHLSIAGSLRRRKETIGDIDILASSSQPEQVMECFVHYDNVSRVLLQGSTKTSVLLKDNLQVDLRVVEPQSFGAALQYFTGSKEHNVHLRSLAGKKGYKLNEYGLFDKKSDAFVVGKEEQEIYTKLGLQYIEPELRENRGEIEASAADKLPKLIQQRDIKGDLHVHSVYSDGHETIQDMVEKAQHLGYRYLGIADHSQSLKVAHGLSEEQVHKKIAEIEQINAHLDTFRVLCGTECDVKPDGTLDYPKKLLAQFDYVGIGIHSKFKMSREEATQRVMKGMDHDYVTFLSHPTCRMIHRRAPFDLDMDQIMEKARETETYLEINSFPDRLDLNDIHVRQAKEHHCQFVINTDAHIRDHLEFIQFGVAVARRGWLEKELVLNALDVRPLLKRLGV
jgi:DNA polymerase (family 10)